jgi:hypothetical protein
MRATWFVALAAGLAISAVPADLEAQQRGNGKASVQRDRDRDRDQRRNERDRYDDRYNDRFNDRSRDRRGVYLPQQQRRGDGPAFCRSGEGHPVFGRRWCVDKGWGLGNDRRARDDRRYDIWDDVILRQPRDRRYDRSMNRSVLQDILGSVMVSRFESYGRQYGSGPLTGRWIHDSRANVLQLMLGRTPIALLVDSDRDGRVDRVQLMQARR